MQSVKNLVLAGRATANSPEGPIDSEGTTYYVYPDKFRQDIKMPIGGASYVFDGSSAFAVTPAGLQPLPPMLLTLSKILFSGK